MLTLSPTLILSSLITPAWLEGISMAALSDSTVIKDCSTLTVSPTWTKISMTVTSLKSPMSGIRSSIGPATTLPGAVAGAAVAAGAAAAGAGAKGAGATAPESAPAPAPSTSSTKTSAPCATLSPKLTFSSLTTPAWLEGISIDALSLSTVIKDCSSLMVSPTFTISSMTVTSSKSPMSGTLISTNAMLFSLLLL